MGGLSIGTAFNPITFLTISSLKCIQIIWIVFASRKICPAHWWPSTKICGVVKIYLIINNKRQVSTGKAKYNWRWKLVSLKNPRNILISDALACIHFLRCLRPNVASPTIRPELQLDASSLTVNNKVLAKIISSYLPSYFIRIIRDSSLTRFSSTGSVQVRPRKSLQIIADFFQQEFVSANSWAVPSHAGGRYNLTITWKIFFCI